jgi:hypothetical protein
MKIHELITFTKNNAILNRLSIESCYEGKYPHFLGSVIELLENQYEYLDLPVENANYDEDHAQLNIFYNPEDLGKD